MPLEAENLHHPFGDVERVIGDVPVVDALSNRRGDARIALLVLTQLSFCRARFVTTVVRLPGLYGQGLRKNAVYDLLHDRSVDAIAGNARFQFYDVDRVWSDVERVLAAGADTANITSEPVAMSDVASRVFNRTLPTPWSDSAPSYDVRSRYAYLVHGDNGYWFDAATVYDGLQRFVAHERGA